LIKASARAAAEGSAVTGADSTYKRLLERID
jgi:hypothetical protein